MAFPLSIASGANTITKAIRIANKGRMLTRLLMLPWPKIFKRMPYLKLWDQHDRSLSSSAVANNREDNCRRIVSPKFSAAETCDLEQSGASSVPQLRQSRPSEVRLGRTGLPKNRA